MDRRIIIIMVVIGEIRSHFIYPAAYERSIFIGQNACDTGATDDINAKIGNLTDDTGDMNNFDKAVGVLEALENKLTPTRKTGSLKARNGEIQEYKEKVKNGENLNDSLSEIEKLHEKSCKERDEKVDELKEKLLDARDTKLYQDNHEEAGKYGVFYENYYTRARLLSSDEDRHKPGVIDQLSSYGGFEGGIKVLSH